MNQDSRAIKAKSVAFALLREFRPGTFWTIVMSTKLDPLASALTPQV